MAKPTRSYSLKLEGVQVPDGDSAALKFDTIVTTGTILKLQKLKDAGILSYEAATVDAESDIPQITIELRFALAQGDLEDILYEIAKTRLVAHKGKIGDAAASLRIDQRTLKNYTRKPSKGDDHE